jgi:hypothetical protein
VHCYIIQCLQRRLATLGAGRSVGRGGRGKLGTKEHRSLLLRNHISRFLRFNSSRMGRIRHNVHPVAIRYIRSDYKTDLEADTHQVELRYSHVKSKHSLVFSNYVSLYFFHIRLNVYAAASGSQTFICENGVCEMKMSFVFRQRVCFLCSSNCRNFVKFCLI